MEQEVAEIVCKTKWLTAFVIGGLLGYLSIIAFYVVLKILIDKPEIKL